MHGFQSRLRLQMAVKTDQYQQKRVIHNAWFAVTHKPHSFWQVRSVVQACTQVARVCKSRNILRYKCLQEYLTSTSVLRNLSYGLCIEETRLPKCKHTTELKGGGVSHIRLFQLWPHTSLSTHLPCPDPTVPQHASNVIRLPDNPPKTRYPEDPVQSADCSKLWLQPTGLGNYYL